MGFALKSAHKNWKPSLLVLQVKGRALWVLCVYVHASVFAAAKDVEYNDRREREKETDREKEEEVERETENKRERNKTSCWKHTVRQMQQISWNSVWIFPPCCCFSEPGWDVKQITEGWDQERLWAAAGVSGGLLFELRRVCITQMKRGVQGLGY